MPATESAVTAAAAPALGVLSSTALAADAALQSRLVAAAAAQSCLGIAAADLEGMLFFVNQAFATMHGYTVEELSGCSLSVCHTPEQMVEVRRFNQQLLETGSYMGEVWHVRRDGSVFPTAMSNSVLTDQDGREIALLATCQDISEQISDHQATYDSEKRFRGLFEAIHAGVLVLRPIDGGTDFEIADLNPGAERIDHLRRSDVVGRRLTVVFPAAESFGLLEVLRRVARTGASASHPPALYNDGRLAGWREYQVFQLPAGEVVAVCQDVTEQQLVLSALRGSERDFRIRNRIFEVFLTIPEPETYSALLRIICEELDSELGSFGHVDNGEFVPEVIEDARSSLDCHARYDQQVFGALCERAIAERRVLNTHGGDNASGSRLVSCAIAAPVICGGEVIAVIHLANKPGGYLEDDQGLLAMIAAQTAPVLHARIERDRRERERDQTAEALRASEQRYRTLAEAAQDLIFIIDDQDLISYVNSYAAHLLGIEPSALIGRPRSELFATSATSDPGQAIAAVFGTGEGSVELTSQQIGDRELWLSTSLVPLRDATGRVVSVLGVSRDLTEQKRAEEARVALEAQIQQAQKLDSLGVLAGGVAHDFNNLLVGILGNADLALCDLPANSPVRRYLDEITSTVRKCADLTGQMLAYAGRRQPAKDPVDVANLVADMGMLLRSSVPRKVELALAFPSGLPVIDADPSQVRQVLMNLVINAAESIGDNCGQIVAKAYCTRVDELWARCPALADPPAPSCYLTLDVSDTGCGMTDATLGRIFEPFFTTKFTGRGLGLAAVHGIVQSHRGGIEVSSELGIGTRVKAHFPSQSRVALAAGPPAPRDQAWRGQGVVLVADDEPIVQSIASRMLERLGFTVATAGDGEEAIAVFHQLGNQITAVILDFKMPMLGGDEVLIELRRFRPDLPALLTSGYAEEDACQRIAERTRASFIAKPYDLITLRGKLRQVLGN